MDYVEKVFWRGLKTLSTPSAKNFFDEILKPYEVHVKQCPWCGETPKVIYPNSEGDAQIDHVCKNGNVFVFVNAASVVECIEIWNSRKGGSIEQEQSQHFIHATQKAHEGERRRKEDEKEW